GAAGRLVAGNLPAKNAMVSPPPGKTTARPPRTPAPVKPSRLAKGTPGSTFPRGPAPRSTAAASKGADRPSGGIQVVAAQRPAPNCSAGIGLRSSHVAGVAATRPKLGFLEVHAENYMAETV